MSHQESFGIMDDCYFVPRTDILSWLNDLLNLNLTKIEQLGSGAVYCQVVDSIYPGKISLQKVNWRAKNDYQFIHNLKILQSAFDRLGIKRCVEVEKLSRAKYQDNLEFIQWMKKYFDTNSGLKGANYSGQQRRGGVQVDFSFADKNVVPKTYNGTGVVIPNIEKPRKQEKGLREIKPSSNNKPRQPIINQKSVSNDKAKPTKKTKLNNHENVSLLRQRIKDLENKLAMVTEVLISEDNSNSKVNMMKKILQLSSQAEQFKEQNEQYEEQDIAI